MRSWNPISKALAALGGAAAFTGGVAAAMAILPTLIAEIVR